MRQINPLNAIFGNMREMRADFATVEEAVEEIRQGRMIVLIDDEDRDDQYFRAWDGVLRGNRWPRGRYYRD